MLSKRIKKDFQDTNKQNSNSEENNRNQLNSEHNDKFQLARRNTIKTLLIVGCLFIICWSQDQIFFSCITVVILLTGTALITIL